VLGGSHEGGIGARIGQGEGADVLKKERGKWWGKGGGALEEREHINRMRSYMRKWATSSPWFPSRYFHRGQDIAGDLRGQRIQRA